MLNARVITSLVASLAGVSDLASPQAKLEPRYARTWEDGAGAGQASIIWADQRTVGANATDSIDLAGALSGLLGGVVAFARIKEILIVPADANVTSLQVGEAVANAFVGPFQALAVGVTIAPGGLFHVRNPSATGWPVTAGTAYILAIENLGATPAVYDIYLIGA
ncbi:hypothetical protein [Sphingomonas sanxanigenens]|uniref:Uncharacterized protein n=1 Tax=Sphingomonas sanxanigenens DSM 19645 = NX02 TaxID=1123269 RepID=W0AJW1_9SPHN|nr:hypothetical protein [Sphingomonas sanxanigenens]AHE57426.1 hypothetical protein NX02_29310 [Sphingomonas sanxanigenens DSM 19645 = NX02]